MTYEIQEIIDGDWKRLAIGESEDLNETRKTLGFCILYLRKNSDILRIVKTTYEVVE